jgi:heme/copper-type cytochrome/quinol oxidase subunit 3
MQRPPTAGENPWSAYTLEWATASPPPAENFATIPTVTSRFPLWSLEHPDDRDVRRGQLDPEREPVPERLGSTLGRIEPHKLAMLLFISSEAIFFGSLLVTFFVHRGGPGASAASLLDVPKVALFSLALFASSGTILLAERQHRRGDFDGMRFWLLATVALGMVFLAGQTLEYRVLLSEGLTLSTGIYGSAFYTLTGFHGLHVLGGLVALLMLWSVSRSAAFRRSGEKAIVPISYYWHFVDAVWLFVFGLVYVLEYVN